MDDTAGAVTFEVEAGVGTITLNRPAVLNALDAGAMGELARVVTRAGLDPAVRAVLLTGAGRAFCAGGDVKQMAAGVPAAARATSGTMSQADALAGASDLHQAISGLRRMPKPVLSAVNGVAAGAGVGLALAGDLVWAGQSATFTLAYTAIGLSPDGGATFFLPRAVGPTRALEYLLTNRKLSAGEAAAVGLISRILPDEELLEAARDMASRLARGPTQAFAEVKELVRWSLVNGLETQLENERQALTRTVGTRDFGEGVAAFVAKREPEFEGR